MADRRASQGGFDPQEPVTFPGVIIESEGQYPPGTYCTPRTRLNRSRLSTFCANPARSTPSRGTTTCQDPEKIVPTPPKVSPASRISPAQDPPWMSGCSAGLDVGCGGAWEPSVAEDAEATTPTMLRERHGRPGQLRSPGGAAAKGL
jgi:hypothetical protein